MAAILDPKTRFFDTYLTKEGRRQLSSGELRMRFVSFSDGLTGYDQSELGVIDPKDGSVFFEAMSRPQDQIISENKSIVNMMSIREPGRQPAFLFEKDADGNRTGTKIQASIFGDQVIKPPDGRVITALTTAGIDRIKIDYDLNEDMYISGSETQELKYGLSQNLRGWWVFEDTMDQIEDAGIPFATSNIAKISTDSEGSAASQLNNQDAFLEAGNTYIFLRNLSVINAIKIGDPVRYGSFTGYVENIVEHNLDDGISLRIKVNNKTGTQALDPFVVGTIGSFLQAGNKISENLKTNSGLATNASYFKVASTDYTPDPSPTFSSVHIKKVSPKIEKSWAGASDKAIRVSLQNEFYGINLRSESDGNTAPLQPGDVSFDDFIDTTAGRTGNQISVWVYFNGDDDLSKTSNIMAVYSPGVDKKFLSIRVYVINDDVFMLFYKSDGAGGTRGPFTISNVISPNTWHKISVAWNHRMAALCVDGSMEKTHRIQFTGDPTVQIFEGTSNAQSLVSYLYRPSTSPADVIIGNLPTGHTTAHNPLKHLDIDFVGETYVRGYIQACEYYKDTSNTDGLPVEPFENFETLGNVGVPVFNNDPGFYKYDRFINDRSNPHGIEVEKVSDSFSSGSLTFTAPYDENISSENFVITLTDTAGRTVNFKAVIDGNNARVNDTNYTFRAPDYDDQPEERVNQRNTVFLANMFLIAVKQARLDGNLNIQPTLVDTTVDRLPAPGRVELRQLSAGTNGDTKILVTSNSSDSVLVSNFSGGLIAKNYVWNRNILPGEVTSAINPRLEAFIGNTYLDFHNTPIEADPFKSRWVNYYPVASETVLHRGALSISGSDAYGKEKVIDKDEIFPSLAEVAEDISDIMSGSLESFKDLLLLGHLDLEKSDENQGFVVERYKQQLSENDVSLLRGENYSQHDDRVFKTRLKNFPFLEHVYGQQNDYLGEELKSIHNLDGPASGLFFQKESTLLNIEEILDNELDEDEDTTSSTRLPNFFFLPPIADDAFVFDDESYSYDDLPEDRPYGAKPPFRQVLNMLTERMDRINDPANAAAPEIQAAAESAFGMYESRYVDDFKGILPEGLVEILASELITSDNDSNKALVSYLGRNANTSALNKITTSLLEFNEEIDFTQTSFNQNTFIQMFELSETDGQPRLSKLAIKDMGVIFRQGDGGNLDLADVEFRGRPMSDMDSRPIGEVTVFSAPRTGGNLVHVFTFGKVFHQPRPGHPGVGIYYLPIFYLECILGE